MDRIKLSKQEKQVLRLIAGNAGCPSAFPAHIFAACARTLEAKGLIYCAWVEGGELLDSRLTDFGKSYLAINPNLRNPIDWKWVITTLIAIASIIALFMACNKI